MEYKDLYLLSFPLRMFLQNIVSFGREKTGIRYRVYSIKDIVIREKSFYIKNNFSK
jgi:hypothetical protein